MRAHWALPLLLIALPGCNGCKDDSNKGGTPPPPPPPSASATKAGACANGGGTVNDPVQAAVFPRTIGGYCIDPQGDTKTYGDRGKLSMDEVCTTAFDGECEVYKSFGLKRVVALRYVDGAGGGGSVEVNLSTFNDTDGGYAMFTKRVIADADPAGPTAPRPHDAGGAAAIGSGRGYVWKGPLLAELTYINEQEPPDQMIKSSEPVLTAVAKAIGANMPGPADKPAAAKALPEAMRVPNGIDFHPNDLLGFKGTGAGAIGFYKEGTKRYRMLAIVRDEPDQAKDTWKIFRAKPGALPVSGLADDAALIVAQATPDAQKTEWVIARKGALVAGVGDEELVLQAGEPLDKQADVRLTKDEKIAHLRAWLATAPASLGRAAPKTDAGAARVTPGQLF